MNEYEAVIQRLHHEAMRELRAMTERSRRSAGQRARYIRAQFIEPYLPKPPAVFRANMRTGRDPKRLVWHRC